jgi:transglutaminase-like putative cysteine protease
MEEFYLEYFIENKYESPVRKANFQLLVLPDPSGQELVDLKIQCSVNQEPSVTHNVFGFETLSYYLGMPFTEFWFRLTARILKAELNPFRVSPLSPSEEFSFIHSLEFLIDHYLFLQPTSLTRMPADAGRIFPVYTGDRLLFNYLSELNTFVFRFLEYVPESTDVNTSMEEVLQIRKGVCQDYAHLLISVCRLNKIPARYVSGYLDQGAGFIGTGQLHAWVEALLPEIGWVGFDSTNNLLADHHYIKIAHGTDFNDCSPIIGVLESAGMQKSIHSVTVTNQ